MFNDIDKKLRLTALANIIFGAGFAWFTAKFAVFVLEYDEYSRPLRTVDAAKVNKVCMILAIACVVYSLLSLWVSLALTFDKRGPFKWLKKIAKGLRIFAWISLIGGWAGGFCYAFWCFFNVVSNNKIVNFISYTFISLIPACVIAFCFAAFWYGLGNAADGGDATYVQNSKLYDMETLHGEDDKRKRCPECGTRTERHSCPNCGTWIE